MDWKEGRYQRINTRCSTKERKMYREITKSFPESSITEGSAWQSNPELLNSCAHNPSITPEGKF